MRRPTAPLGERFGNLIVVGMASVEFPGQNPRWVCKCDCGESAVLPAGYIRSGITQNCGGATHTASKEDT